MTKGIIVEPSLARATSYVLRLRFSAAATEASRDAASSHSDASQDIHQQPRVVPHRQQVGLLVLAHAQVHPAAYTSGVNAQHGASLVECCRSCRRRRSCCPRQQRCRWRCSAATLTLSLEALSRRGCARRRRRRCTLLTSLVMSGWTSPQALAAAIRRVRRRRPAAGGQRLPRADAVCCGRELLDLLNCSQIIKTTDDDIFNFLKI